MDIAIFGHVVNIEFARLGHRPRLGYIAITLLTCPQAMPRHLLGAISNTTEKGSVQTTVCKQV